MKPYKIIKLTNITPKLGAEISGVHLDQLPRMRSKIFGSHFGTGWFWCSETNS